MKRISSWRRLWGRDVSAPLSTLATAPSADVILADQLMRSADGDLQAFTEVYDASIGRLFQLAVVATADLGTAERVTRQAYVEAWTSASRFDPAENSAAAWLASILWGHAMRSLATHPVT